MFKYYTALTGLSIFAHLTMLQILSSDNLLPQKSKKYFKYTFILFFFVCSLEWLFLFLKLFTYNNILFQELSIFVSRVLGIYIPICIGLAFTQFRNPRFVKGLLASSFILNFIAFIHLFGLYIDQDNIYTIRNLYIANEVIFFSCLMIMLKNIYTLSVHYQSKNKFLLIIIFITIIIENLIPFFNSNMYINWLTGTSISIILYTYFSSLINKVDPLTSLLNRRCYENKIKNLKNDCLILLLDLNKFKAINDTYGHSYGDEALSKMGELILEIYNKYGNSYRIGGDEFCIILDKKKESVTELNELLSDKIKKTKQSDCRFPTVSIGYGNYYVSKNNLKEAINEADKMMYRVKGEQV